MAASIRRLVIGVLALAIALVTGLSAVTDVSAQAVPETYFDGVLFEEPVPTHFETGSTVLLKGVVEDRSVFLIEFIFGPLDEGETIRFAVTVFDGRFERGIFFDHDQAGSYFLDLRLFTDRDAPISTRFFSFEVAQGSGAIDLPPGFHTSLRELGYFEPNVISSADSLLPPLFVRTVIPSRTVTTFVTGPDGQERAHDLRDDGLPPDSRAEGHRLETKMLLVR